MPDGRRPAKQTVRSLFFFQECNFGAMNERIIDVSFATGRGRRFFAKTWETRRQMSASLLFFQKEINSLQVHCAVHLTKKRPNQESAAESLKTSLGDARLFSSTINVALKFLTTRDVCFVTYPTSGLTFNLQYTKEVPAV